MWNVFRRGGCYYLVFTRINGGSGVSLSYAAHVHQALSHKEGLIPHTTEHENGLDQACIRQIHIGEADILLYSSTNCAKL